MTGPRAAIALLAPALLACVCRSISGSSNGGAGTTTGFGGGSTTGFQGEGCAGAVTVSQGRLGGGGSQGFAASGFYAFGPRLFLTSGSCIPPWGSGDQATLAVSFGAGAGVGTYVFSPDGGSLFEALYSYVDSSGVGGETWMLVSGTVTLMAVDPVEGLQGSYDLDLGGADGLSLVESGSFIAPVCDLCGLGTGDVDGGEGLLGIAGLVACDQLYAAENERCGPALPQAERARQVARFERVCENEAELTGSDIAAASLEACASQLQATPCDASATPPACDFHGSLEAGSSCADDLQCQSGSCLSGLFQLSPEGQYGENTCGLCQPLAAIGGDCQSAACPPGASCKYSNGSKTWTCVALPGEPGLGPCDAPGSTCPAGSYCAGPVGECEAVGEAGGPCPCSPPLSCDARGHRCLQNADGGAAQEVWAGSGEPCSDAIPCLVGSCFFGFGPPPIGSGPDAGQCPIVIPDGDFCWGDFGSETCDAFSICFEGTCMLTDSAACRG